MPPLFRLLSVALLASCAFNNPATTASGGASAALSPTPTAALAAAPSVIHSARTVARPPREQRSATQSLTPPPASSNTRLVRLPQRRVTRAVARAARAIIDAHGRDPLGTEIAFEADGQQYVARIEQHYHPPGGPKRPWGPHPGVSVMVAAERGSRFAKD